MITYSLFAIVFGLAGLLYALRRAPEGYENGDGFHRKEIIAFHRRK